MSWRWGCFVVGIMGCWIDTSIQINGQHQPYYLLDYHKTRSIWNECFRMPCVPLQEVITWLTRPDVGPTWRPPCWERLSPPRYRTTRYDNTHTHTVTHIPTWAQSRSFIVLSHRSQHTHTHTKPHKHTLLCSLSAESLQLIKDGRLLLNKGVCLQVTQTQCVWGREREKGASVDSSSPSASSNGLSVSSGIKGDFYCAVVKGEIYTSIHNVVHKKYSDSLLEWKLRYFIRKILLKVQK